MKTRLCVSAFVLLLTAASAEAAVAQQRQVSATAVPAVYAALPGAVPVQNVAWRRYAYRPYYGPYAYNAYRPYYGGVYYRRPYVYGAYYPPYYGNPYYGGYYYGGPYYGVGWRGVGWRRPGLYYW
jgi:hypothetical protein